MVGLHQHHTLKVICGLSSETMLSVRFHRKISDSSKNSILLFSCAFHLSLVQEFGKAMFGMGKI